MASKQKILAIAGLITGSLVWGLVWYPYRALDEAGVSGVLAAFISYTFALLIGLFFTGPVWRELRYAGWWGVALMISAGGANVGYVLAVLNGEVMRVLLLFYLAPLWTVILSRWMLGEKLNHYGYAVIALSLSGAFTMLWHERQGFPIPQNNAEWMGLGAGMCFAWLNVTVRRTQHLSINFKAASVWFGTILFTSPILIYMGGITVQLQSIAIETWLLLALVGLVLGATSFIVQYGVTHLPANQAIVLLLSELIFAAIAAYFLAGEEMGTREWVGAALIVSASLMSGKVYSEPSKMKPH